MNAPALFRGVVLGLAMVPLLAGAGGLDGRRFEGVFIESGKTSGDADTLIFEAENRSTARPDLAAALLAVLLCTGPLLAATSGRSRRFLHGLFANGRFRSTACDRHGYADVAYEATTAGDVVFFEAETESPRYGNLVWKGFIREGKLDATAMSIRQGKAPVENWVVAGEKK